MNNNKFSHDINHRYGFDNIHQNLNVHLKHTFIMEHKNQPIYNENNTHNPFCCKYMTYHNNNHKEIIQQIQELVYDDTNNEVEEKINDVKEDDNTYLTEENVNKPKNINYKTFLNKSKSIQW